jgi:hypothetical protein
VQAEFKNGVLNVHLPEVRYSRAESHRRQGELEAGRASPSPARGPFLRPSPPTAVIVFAQWPNRRRLTSPSVPPRRYLHRPAE